MSDLTPPPPPAAPVPPALPRSASNATLYAILSLVFGIASWLFLPIIGSVAGILFAALSHKQAQADGVPTSGMATAGRILSWVSFAIIAITILVFLVIAFVVAVL